MEEEEEFYLDELQIIWRDQVRLFFFFFPLFSFPWNPQLWTWVWIWNDWIVSNSWLHKVAQSFQMFSIRSPELSHQQPVAGAAARMSSPFWATRQKRENYLLVRVGFFKFYLYFLIFCFIVFQSTNAIYCLNTWMAFKDCLNSWTKDTGSFCSALSGLSCVQCLPDSACVDCRLCARQDF